MEQNQKHKSGFIAVIGRPNVGKSTLINTLIGQKIAIMSDKPQTTRNRILCILTEPDAQIVFLDTPGIHKPKHKLGEYMVKAAEGTLKEVDAIFFVVDATEKMGPGERYILERLQVTRKPVILVVNKIDSVEQEMNIYEFYSLGLGDPIGVSAVNLMNLGDLLDEVLKYIKKVPAMDDDDEAIHIALVGRPNVGKSSLTNALLGQERVIVSNVPGTTRDSIDTHWSYEGTDFVLIDTAGMRRKAKIDILIVHTVD